MCCDSQLNFELTDGTGSPNANNVALLHASVDNTVVGRREHVAEVQRRFIGHRLGDGKAVDIGVWDADVLRDTGS